MTFENFILGVFARRAAALLVLVLFVTAVYIAVGPLGSHRIEVIDDQINESVATRQRLQSILNLASQTDSAVQQSDLQRFSGDFLSGTQDALVAAELQTRLRAMVIGKSAELSSARMLPSKVIGEQTYLGLRLQIQGHMSSIHQIIHTIEYGSPLLFVDRAVFRPEQSRGAVQDPSAEPIPAIFAELDVYGAKWLGPVTSNPVTPGPQP